MLTGTEERVTIRMGHETRERIRDAARLEGNAQAAIMRRALLLGLAAIERDLAAQGVALTKVATS